MSLCSSDGNPWNGFSWCLCNLTEMFGVSWNTSEYASAYGSSGNRSKGHRVFVEALKRCLASRRNVSEYVCSSRSMEFGSQEGSPH